MPTHHGIVPIGTWQWQLQVFKVLDICHIRRQIKCAVADFLLPMHTTVTPVLPLQVVLATQLTSLEIKCASVASTDAHAEATVAAKIQLGVIAANLKQLQELLIHCDLSHQHDLLTMLEGSSLPQLQELLLFVNAEDCDADKQSLDQWCSVIQQARPALTVECFRTE